MLGLAVIVPSVLLFGPTTDSGDPDWVSIVTAVVGLVMAITGLFVVFRSRGRTHHQPGAGRTWPPDEALRDRSRVGATATVPEGPSEQGLGAVAASVVARDAPVEVVNMLGIGPIPVAGNDPIGSPFVTTMDWTAFAVAVAAFVVLFLVAVIVAIAGRGVREAPVSPRLRPQVA